LDRNTLNKIRRNVVRHKQEVKPRPTIIPSRTRRPSSAESRMYIAEVDSDAAGGGYYNCHLQTLDATDWNTDIADQLDDTGDSVVVCNIAEIGADRHELEANDRMICWKFTDDEGDGRYVGIPALRIGIKTDTVSGTADTLGGKFIYRWLEEW